jgi:hypothetical protein
MNIHWEILKLFLLIKEEVQKKHEKENLEI